MTGLNSNAHELLALAGFEIYGRLLEPSIQLPALGFVPQGDFDGRGLIAALATAGGKEPYRNPHDRGAVAVSASSLAPGVSLSAAVGERAGRFATAALPDSWVMLDLKERRLTPTHYGLRHYDSWDTEALRNWVLEGSNDARTWRLLSTHANDGSLARRGATKTWTLARTPDTDQAYRYFRVRQTGLNSNQHHLLALSGIELYGLMLGPAP
jgi:hypothetical protein